MLKNSLGFLKYTEKRWSPYRKVGLIDKIISSNHSNNVETSAPCTATTFENSIAVSDFKMRRKVKVLEMLSSFVLLLTFSEDTSSLCSSIVLVQTIGENT